MKHQGLTPEAESAITALEEASGYPVTLMEDRSLSVLATIKIGTPLQPIHVIRYQPNSGAPDYRIAMEVGYALRTFRRAPERRFHLGGQPTALAVVVAELKEMHSDLEDAAAHQLGQNLFNSLMTQLRSCPTGILIDLWIKGVYPGLATLQAQCLEAQALDYTQCLASEIDQRFPPTIVQANRAMNAAQALFAADLLNRPHLLIPYRAAKLERIGADLLGDVTAQPLDAIDDQQLIERWAERLGIRHWIKWLPFV